MSNYFAGGHLRYIDGEWRDDNGNVVEIELVQYAVWILQDYTFTKFMCSNCKSKNHAGHEKRCPNCGAKMIRGENHYEVS